jgi:ATP-dependent exoDNAse (exonuclease V) alpha subunit
MAAVQGGAPGPSGARSFFVYSPGGCGKTFTFNLMLDATRAQGKIALAVAASGIAALLMEGGVTAHSRFKIPLQLQDGSYCNIKAQSDTAKLLREASLIVWDEVGMMHRHGIEAVDRTLRFLMGNDIPFGGKCVVLAGDFRQVAPVIKRGTRATIVNSTLPRSPLWRDMQVFPLTVNMRVQKLLAQGRDAAQQQDFANMLLAMGEGRTGDSWTVPPGMLAPTSNPADLIDAVYGANLFDEDDGTARTAESLIERAILTPRNEDVNRINDMVCARWPGEEHSYTSSDEVGSDDNPTLYPPEFLNSLEPQGMPPHQLKLKVGFIVILMRNLNPTMGLANGTRLVIKALGERVIQAEVVTGAFKGTIVLIPRIALTSSDSELPFSFTRRQYPIRPAFCMSINKSQGQTFSKIGVYLPTPVFSHGQLYVGVSRVGEPDGVVVMIAHEPLPGAPPGSTPNVVYTEIFDANGL